MTSPSHQERRQIFERNDLLGRLSPEEIDALLTYSRVEHYAIGNEIFAKGSPGNSLMLVLRGKVKINSMSLDGKQIVFNIINPGEIVGEIGMLDGGERTGDAIAMSDCEVLVLNRRDFMPLLERHADMCLMLIKTLCARLRHTTEQVEDLQFRQVAARIAKALLQLSERSEQLTGTQRGRELHLSQSELANIAACTRESVNKQLQAWHRSGYIDLAKGTIVIRDPAALERLI